MVNVIQADHLKSIAIPPLGCGKWEKVKALMEEYLSPLTETDIFIYVPNNGIKEILQKEAVQKDVKLTSLAEPCCYMPCFGTNGMEKWLPYLHQTN